MHRSILFLNINFFAALAFQIRLKLNHAFSALRKPVAAVVPTHTSDGEDDERPPDPDVLEERLKHCTTVKKNAVRLANKT